MLDILVTDERLIEREIKIAFECLLEKISFTKERKLRDQMRAKLRYMLHTFDFTTFNNQGVE